MPRIAATIGGMRMERKLFLVFLILITLPLSFIGYVTYGNYSRSLEEKTTVYSTKMLASMMVRIDDYIEDMVGVSSIPAYQDEIRQNLMRSNRYYEQRASKKADSEGEYAHEDFDLLLSIQRGIENNISFINQIKRGANSVYVFDRFGNGYYHTASGSIRLSVNESYREWLKVAEGSSGEAKLLGTQKYTSNLQSEKYAFTVVRSILDQSLKPIGLIVVDANMSVIEDGIKELDGVTQGGSFIIDGAGNVIYDSERSRIATNISEDPAVKQATGSKGSFYMERDGEKRLYIYTTSPNTKWKVVTSIPASVLTRDAVHVRNVTGVATLVTLLVALLLSFFLSYALTNPLRKMTRLMKTVQEGDFNVQFQVKYRDEVGQLGNQFNRMIVRIDQLIRDIYEMETNKKKAELQALQNQINPHFMYNTLETIRMSAELSDDQATADMLMILGKLLRYSISDLEAEVSVSDEMAHVRNYVELLNYRYQNRFRLETDMPDELAAVPVIKLLLQPIVENAIYHGLDERKTVMRVTISGETEDGNVRIRIEDDGIGMDDDTLARLTRSLTENRDPARSSGSGGIGLRNVHERIKLHYGSGYGMKVTSIAGRGTAVTLHLPLAKGGGR
ncbi:sensor histidine kinase [Paenibacillus sp. LHD-117]|uniref:cache domain-containing sensor histidine kinase n=1 Tax=Paenibacillus sp. LHD-117 TaxID=3071412 RepID=UPI0027E0CD66|nr:sensor histidine kinase [Paenibacillus sp. LHD-117]MDQ6421218.1 sensor histidine kinase [Paenibacillus sp. LHD-117]